MGAEENAVTRSILAAIALQGDKAIFVRVQAGAIKIGNRLIKMASAGTADLIGSYRGRPIAIEVKTAKGRQTDTQRDFEAKWEATGGGAVYAVLRSGSEALELFQRLDREADGLHPPKIT